MRFLATLLISIAANPVFSKDTVQLDSQLIVGDSLKEKGHQVQFYTRDEFIGQYFSVTDLLQNTVGIQVRKGGIGDVLKLSIRGSSHNQIDFIVDGHKINDANFGGFDPNKIPLNQIQSIAIYQGNQSPDGSLAAIGGTVVIETLSPLTNQQVVHTGYATYNTFTAGLIQQSGGSAPTLFSYDYLSSDANYRYPVHSPYNNPDDRDNIESLHNNEYLSHSVLAKSQFNVLSNGTIGIKANIIKSEKGIPAYNRNPKPNTAKLSTTEKDIQSFFEYSYSDSITNKTVIQLSVVNELIDDRDGFVNSAKNKNAYRNSKVELKNSTKIKTKLTETFIHFSNSLENFDENNHLIPNDQQCLSTIGNCDKKAEQTETQLGTYITIHSPSYHNSFLVNANLMNVIKKQNPKYGDLPKTSGEKTYSSWGVGWNSDITGNLTSNLTLTKGVRIPSIFELYGDRGFQIGNEDLKAEESIDRNLDVTYLGRTFTTTTSLYHRSINNLITNDVSQGVARFSNISSSQVVGFQNSVRIKAKNIAATVSIQLQDSLTESDNVTADSKKIPGIYHSTYIASLTYFLQKNLKVELQHRKDDDIYADLANRIKLDSSAQSNIKTALKGNRYQLYFNIDNMFNNQIEDVFNRPAPGRTYSLSIHFNL